MTKKLLALVLSFCMTFSLIPANVALAIVTDDGKEEISETILEEIPEGTVEEEPTEEGTAPETSDVIEEQEEQQAALDEIEQPDLTADMESSEDWERTFENVLLSGNWNEDVLAIAKTQIGYTESSKNYVLQNDGVTRNGYTRFGEWYGDPYGDWCTMFCAFCLHYADVDKEMMPHNADCSKWVKALVEKGLYHPVSEEYTPVAGDLVFFDFDEYDPNDVENREADHVGFVSEVVFDDDNKCEKIKTIEGNANNCVKETVYEFSDSMIIGFGEMPENPDYLPVSEQCITSAPAEDGAIATVSGLLPQKAQVVISRVTLDEEKTSLFFGEDNAEEAGHYVFYDVAIFVNDHEWEPDEGKELTVSISSSQDSLRRTGKILHIEENNKITEVEGAVSDDNSVAFTLSGFSLLGVEIEPDDTVPDAVLSDIAGNIALIRDTTGEVSYYDTLKDTMAAIGSESTDAYTVVFVKDYTITDKDATEFGKHGAAAEKITFTSTYSDGETTVTNTVKIAAARDLQCRCGETVFKRIRFASANTTKYNLNIYANGHKIFMADGVEMDKTVSFGVYGGSNALVSDAAANITLESGTYARVFGGNSGSNKFTGSIEINVRGTAVVETMCLAGYNANSSYFPATNSVTAILDGSDGASVSTLKEASSGSVIAPTICTIRNMSGITNIQLAASNTSKVDLILEGRVSATPSAAMNVSARSLTVRENAEVVFGTSGQNVALNIKNGNLTLEKAASLTVHGNTSGVIVDTGNLEMGEESTFTVEGKVASKIVNAGNATLSKNASFIIQKTLGSLFVDAGNLTIGESAVIEIQDKVNQFLVRAGNLELRNDAELRLNKGFSANTYGFVTDTAAAPKQFIIGENAKVSIADGVANCAIQYGKLLIKSGGVLSFHKEAVNGKNQQAIAGVTPNGNIELLDHARLTVYGSSTGGIAPNGSLIIGSNSTVEITGAKNSSGKIDALLNGKIVSNTTGKIGDLVIGESAVLKINCDAKGTTSIGKCVIEKNGQILITPTYRTSHSISDDGSTYYNIYRGESLTIKDGGILKANGSLIGEMSFTGAVVLNENTSVDIYSKSIATNSGLVINASSFTLANNSSFAVVNQNALTFGKQATMPVIEIGENSILSFGGMSTMQFYSGEITLHDKSELSMRKACNATPTVYGNLNVLGNSKLTLCGKAVDKRFVKFETAGTTIKGTGSLDVLIFDNLGLNKDNVIFQFKSEADASAAACVKQPVRDMNSISEWYKGSSSSTTKRQILLSGAQQIVRVNNTNIYKGRVYSSVTPEDGSENLYRFTYEFAPDKGYALNIGTLGFYGLPLRIEGTDVSWDCADQQINIGHENESYEGTAEYNEDGTLKSISVLVTEQYRDKLWLNVDWLGGESSSGSGYSFPAKETVENVIEADGYKATGDLTDRDKWTEYQKNYQLSYADGEDSYLYSTAEWTDKANGEASVTLSAAMKMEKLDGRPVYIMQTCTAHGFTADIATKNIEDLQYWYGSFDFVMQNDENPAVGYENNVVMITDTGDLRSGEIIREGEFAGSRHWQKATLVSMYYYFFDDFGNQIRYPSAVYVTADTINFGDYPEGWDKNNDPRLKLLFALLKQYAEDDKYFYMTSSGATAKTNAGSELAYELWMAEPKLYPGSLDYSQKYNLQNPILLYSQHFDEAHVGGKETQMHLTLSDYIMENFDIVSTEQTQGTELISGDDGKFTLLRTGIPTPVNPAALTINLKAKEGITLSGDWFDTNAPVARADLLLNNSKLLDVLSPQLSGSIVQVVKIFKGLSADEVANLADTFVITAVGEDETIEGEGEVSSIVRYLALKEDTENGWIAPTSQVINPEDSTIMYSWMLPEMPKDITVTEEGYLIDGYECTPTTDIYTIVNEYEKENYRLTIRKNAESVFDSNDRFIFTVTGPEEYVNQVVLAANEEVVLVNLKAGVYTVSENTGWSWRYSCSNPSDIYQEIEISSDEENKVVFNNNLDDLHYFSGSAYAVNTEEGRKDN